MINKLQSVKFILQYLLLKWYVINLKIHKLSRGRNSDGVDTPKDFLFETMDNRSSTIQSTRRSTNS